jgi:hypothetical protein
MKRRLLALLPIALFFTLTNTLPFFGGPERLPRSLKRIPSHSLASPGTLHNERGKEPAQSTHVVSKDILNMRSIMGGGRKLIRHDCGSQDALEAVFTKDVGVPAASLHSALSLDEGVMWGLVGPLGEDPLIHESEHSIAFSGGLTHLAYVEGESLYFAQDHYQCLQAFSRLGAISDSTHVYSSPQVIFEPPSTIYLSAFAPLTGNAYFTKTTDNGATWGPMVRINDIGTQDFDMKGFNGPLAMDADGDVVAFLAMVVLDENWAGGHGFLPNVSYPAYTQTTDGGDTWSELRLLWGNDGSQYPRGHSGDPGFDEQLHYIGGVEEVGYAQVQDNVAITVDGKVHLAYTMIDTTFGYVGVFHTVGDNGSLANAHVGYPEDPELSGESGVAYMPGIAQSDGGHFSGDIVVGWTEFVQPGGIGDICYAHIRAGNVEGGDPVNATHTPTDDETYQRIVDRLYPPSSDEFFIDWLFLYYSVGGDARDSTLWHLQAEHHLVGIEDGGTGAGGSLPRAAILSQNYPNPFNPSTTIAYSLERPGRVSIEITDVRGRLVKRLEDGTRETGTYRIVWDGRGDRGEQLPSGVYLYRLRMEGKVSPARKMLLLR